MTDKIKPSDEMGSDVNELLQKKDFGSILKRTREKSGMSLADVSENLLISIDVIKALENSQAEALPALAFTQGYIRSYARLLNVSADEIINDYVLMAPQSKQVLTPHTVLPVQKSSSDIFVKAISFTFVVVAIGILVYWFYNFDFDVKTDNENVVTSIQLKQQDNKDFISDDVSLKVVIKEVQEPVDVLIVDDEIKPQVEEIVSAEQQPQEQLKEDLLLLSAQGESWCEIQDSTGKRLYYRLLNNGEEVTLKGIAPFTVFLGNAPKIRVEINNKIVEFDNLINKSSNIANLEISKNAAVVRLPNH